MRPRKKTVEEGGIKVPAYIVTYSDMVTLLLTFFVMLLSLSSVQDPELFYQGRGSFIKSIRELGLGMLYNRKRGPNFGKVKVKYFIKNPDKLFPDRSISAKEEEIRRLFKKVNQSMKTMPSQITAQKTNFSIADIHFSPGEAMLKEPDNKFLIEFCSHLPQDFSDKPVKLYVLGLAPDAGTEKEQWILSAKRAQAVADYIQKNLPSASKSAVYSWGAGPGGNWVANDSPAFKQSHILLAVLR